MKKDIFKFDFAISYASEDEGLASDLYRLLNEKGANVFFAKNDKAYLFGKSLSSALPYIFGPHTKFVIPIVSKHYILKQWTKYEFDIAKKEGEQRGFEFILPIRVDDNELQGLASDVMYIDIRKEGIFSTAEIIMQKLREIYPTEELAVPTHWVVTFGVLMEDLIEKQELPPAAPEAYAELCDWLEEDLMRRLSNSKLLGLEQIEDARDGETLSVRIGFKWGPDEGPLDFGDLAWWEILEITDFESLYGTQIS